MKITLSPVAALALSLGAASALAQVTQLDPIIVNATRVPEDIADIPAAVSAVEGDAIRLGTEQLGIDESLGGVPGLFFLNRYNFAQDIRASIRGFGARSNFGIRGIKIIVDGIPETLPDGQGSVDGIDLGSAEQISVIRGPASSLYGNASGGAIVVESESGPPEPFAQARLLYGDFGHRAIQAKTGGDTGNVNYLLNVSDVRIDGYRDHSEAENRQFNGRLEIQVSNDTRLLATIHHTDQPLANDAGGLNAAEVEADRTAARDRNVEFDAGEALEQTRAGLLYETSLGEGRLLEARAYHTSRDFSNRLPFESGGAVDLDRGVAGAGIKFVGEGRLAGRDSRLVAGIDYDRQDDDRRRFDNLAGLLGPLAADQNELVESAGIYAQNRTALGSNSELTIGIRYDEVTFDVDDRFVADGDDSGRVEFDHLSPMLGLSYAPDDGTRIYATISTGFETPTTTELANPEGGGFNQALEPQVSTNYELGIKKESGRYRFEAAVFHIDVEDELVPFELPDQPGRSFFQNAGSSERDGLELAFARKIGDGVEVGMSYTWSDFVFDRFTDSDGERLDGNAIPGIPEHMFYADIEWYGDSGWYAVWDVMYTGSFYADNGNLDEIEAYTVSNLRLGYSGFTGFWEFAPFLGVNNLFDEEYNGNVRINAFGGRYFEPAPERNLYGGIVVRRDFGD